jgi:hypothetical protein
MSYTLHGPLTDLVAAHQAEDLQRARLHASPELTYIGQLCLDIRACLNLTDHYTAIGDNPAATHFRWLAEALRRGLETSE